MKRITDVAVPCYITMVVEHEENENPVTLAVYLVERMEEDSNITVNRDLDPEWTWVGTIDDRGNRRYFGPGFTPNDVRRTEET